MIKMAAALTPAQCAEMQRFLAKLVAVSEYGRVDVMRFINNYRRERTGARQRVKRGG